MSADFCLVGIELLINAFKIAEVAFDLLKTLDLFLDIGNVSDLLKRSVLLARDLYILQ